MCCGIKSSSLREFISPLVLLQVASALLLTSCADCERARGARYPGDIPPCDVPAPTSFDGEQRSREAGLAAAKARRFWEPGPYYTWNTSPLRECAFNPTTAQEVDGEKVAYYLTYPASKSPTEDNLAAVATGPFPLVVFAHANHDRVCQVFDGYYSLHDHWASWGFVVASVDSTRWNCMPGNRDNIRSRALDQRAVIEDLLARNEDPESPYYRRIDPEKIILAGHSRGGGASLLNAAEMKELAAVINLQGVSLQNYGFGAPAIETPLMGITAGNDVDLNFPAVEGNEDLARGPYTWLDFEGAIHAWTADISPKEPDDRPDLKKLEQQDLTEFFTTAHLLHHVGSPAYPPGTSSELLFSYEGARVASDNILEGAVRMRWRAHTEEEILVDDFQTLERLETNDLGGRRQLVGFSRAQVTYAYNPEHEERYNPPAAKALWLETLTWPGLVIEHLSPQPGGHLEVPADWRLRARVRGRTEWSKPVIRLEIVREDGSSSFLTDARTRLAGGAIPNRYVQIDAPLSSDGDGPSREPLRLREVRIHVDDGTLILDDLRLTPPTHSSTSAPAVMDQGE
ncbi:MAG: dienelactone hydrolase family protein [Myxococcota bacterium]|nr:dienelactone hydrolase family protein [Myxococcota bacterium]